MEPLPAIGLDVSISCFALLFLYRSSRLLPAYDTNRPNDTASVLTWCSYSYGDTHAGKPSVNYLGQQSPFLREPSIGPPATVPIHFAPLRTRYHKPDPGSRTLLNTLHVRSTAQEQWQRQGQWLVLYSLVGLSINMYR